MRLTKIRCIMVIAFIAIVILIGFKTDAEEMNRVEEVKVVEVIDELNIRKEPDENSEIINIPMKGDMIAVYNNDEWLQSINPDDGEPVYVYGEYLSEEEPEILSYTDDELDLLAHLIYSENGTEGELCMMYTGSVVLNRMKHEYFPDTMYDVIYQKGQYAVTWGAKAINKTPSDEAYEIAERLLKYGSVLPDNVVFQAEFDQGDGLYAQIGKTKFCYIDN